MSLRLILLFALIANAAQAAQCDTTTPQCAVGLVVQKYRKLKLLSGTLLIKKGNKQYSWSSGNADDDKKLKNTRDTVYLIASISKAFAAAGILKLIDERKLDLNDTLHSLIPEYPREQLTAKRTEITLYHLLTHTSGLPEAYEIREIESRLDRETLTFTDIVNAVKKYRLRFTPGTRYEYSNTGYLILGEIVRRVSGISYHEFLQNNFLEPFGMQTTTVGPPLRSNLTLARSYLPNRGKREDFQKKYGLHSLAASDLYADTNIYTTAPDLATWAKDIASGIALSNASTREMFTPHLKEYGFGWVVFSDRAGNKVYEHTGFYSGFESWLRYFPEHDLALVWLSNQEMGGTNMGEFFNAANDAALSTKW